MGRIKSALGRFFGFLSRKFNNSTKNLTLADIQAEYSGKTSGNSAMNLSGVYSCVDIISNTFSKLPFFLMDNNTKEHIQDDNLYMLLNVQPNEIMTASIFKKILATSMLLDGNAYAIPFRRGLEINSIYPIKPGNVSIMTQTVNKKTKVYYKVTIGDDDFVLREDEIIHLKAFTYDGITGISPLTHARLCVGVGLNQEEFQQSFYASGGRPAGTLNVNADLSSKEIVVKNSDGTTTKKSYKDIIREEWEKAGSVKGFRTPVLDFGITYNAIAQISPADMDFVNSKTVNLEDIARFFNIPAYKIGAGKQTYSSNEQGAIDYITNGIVPRVTQWEQELTIKLLPYNQVRQGISIRANVAVELRGDTASQSAWLEKMIQLGLYNRNEGRAYLDLPKVEEYGDDYFIGPNYTPIKTLFAGKSVAEITPNPTKENDQDNNETEENDTGE